VEPRLLYVGRLAEEKGADVAIDSFALLKQRVPSARLTVAGEGPLRSDLEQRARALGIRDAIDFIGWVIPDRVMSLMGDHAAVIVPSRQDSFPLVALEAGAMARPVIASRVGGLPEIIEQHRTGVLVECGDRAGFADAAARLFADAGAAVGMGRAARQRIETLFSWRQHVASYDALYRALVPHRAPEPIAAAG
jgi:glycosyltransferase involved in cell wall biosynthesis